VDRKIVDDVEHRMVRLLHIRRLNN
jgi:hypothetical protein